MGLATRDRRTAPRSLVVFLARAPRDDVSPRAGPTGLCCRKAGAPRRSSSRLDLLITDTGGNAPNPCSGRFCGCFLSTRSRFVQNEGCRLSGGAQDLPGEETRTLTPRSRDSTAVGWPQQSPSRQAAGAAAAARKPLLAEGPAGDRTCSCSPAFTSLGSVTPAQGPKPRGSSVMRQHRDLDRDLNQQAHPGMASYLIGQAGQDRPPARAHDPGTRPWQGE